jgi:Lrp/AsnC family transcriptional regulator, leucine-responsive regulatory protein
MSRPLDTLDRRILGELQRDCAQSAARLAERCGTTESTALRRWKRMRRDGVIQREVAIVDPAKAGRPIDLIVRVRLERERGGDAARFVERVAACPEVAQLYFVTGTSDYVILLCVYDMAQYDAFLKTQLLGDPLVVMSDTNVVIRPIKRSLSIPVDPLAGV